MEIVYVELEQIPITLSLRKKKNETNKTSAFTFHCEGSAVTSIFIAIFIVFK